MTKPTPNVTQPRARTDRLPRPRLGAGRGRSPKETVLKITPIPQTCAIDPCDELARFVVAVAAARDGGIRAARRCCGEHLEEAVFWAEGLVEIDPRARYALISRWWPWALELHEVPA